MSQRKPIMATAEVMCAEDIILPALLCPGGVVHEPLNSRPTVTISSPEANADTCARVLPLEKEHDVVATLAFLAATDDNPNHVLAVALDKLSREQMRICVAINKSRPDSGSRTLHRVWSVMAFGDYLVFCSKAMV